MQERTLEQIIKEIDHKRWGDDHELGSVQKLKLVRDPSVSVKIPRGPITTPAKALSMFRDFYRDVDVEVIGVLSLNSKNEYLGLSPAGVGTIDHVEFDIAEILKVMFAHNAAAFIVAHNHPSGRTVRPSEEDLLAMQELKFISERIRRPMRDFIIVGFNAEGIVQYYSHRDEQYDL